MREILFRGKRKKGDKRWVEGDLLHGYSGFGITNRYYAGSSFEVDSETVGQYTGLTDKNGARIFEGDIVKYSEIDIDGSDDKYIGVIYYNQSKANYVIQKGKYMANFVTSWICDVEVIGNIYDNPELMEVEE